MNRFLNLLKRIPVDLGQGVMAEKTEGKRIGLACIPPGDNGLALDLGARKGTQTQILKDKGYRVVSADLEPLFETCLALDANDPLPFKDEAFDVIWCSEVIEHLREPETVLNELRRVTRRGGQLILTTPNSGMWLFRALSKFGLPPAKVQHAGHLHFFTTEQISRLAPDAELFGFFPYVGFKATLTTLSLIGILSPTFVLSIRKAH